jgi:hypothetical protein
LESAASLLEGSGDVTSESSPVLSLWAGMGGEEIAECWDSLQGGDVDDSEAPRERSMNERAVPTSDCRHAATVETTSLFAVTPLSDAPPTPTDCDTAAATVEAPTAAAAAPTAPCPDIPSAASDRDRVLAMAGKRYSAKSVPSDLETKVTARVAAAAMATACALTRGEASSIAPTARGTMRSSNTVSLVLGQPVTLVWPDSGSSSPLPPAPSTGTDVACRVMVDAMLSRDA